MNKVIAIAGFRNAGKDAVTEILKNKFGYVRLAWIDPVCNVISDSFDLTAEEVWMLKGLSEGARLWRKTPNPKFDDCTPLEVIRRVGTHFRDIKKDVWVNKVIKEIQQKQKFLKNYKCVVSGTRYLNEAQEIKNRNGELWFIERPGNIPDLSHVSEQGIEQLKEMADRIILNDGSIEDLEKKICE